MHRIYSNYTDEEFGIIEKAAEDIGMTISAFCKTAVIEKVVGKMDKSSANLIMELHKKLESLEHDKEFIVSELYPEEVWGKLNRSEKNTISKQLAKHVRENPEKFIVNAILPGKITQYKKIG